MAAFGQSLARDDHRRSRCADTISTLTNFFAFVDSVAAMAGFLNERLDVVQRRFRAIMHKFIFKFGDVDGPMIKDLCEGLLEYYGFLASAGLVPADEFQEFQTLVRGSQQGLVDKTERYNAIRHNGGVSEEAKEAIRQELFGGDHVWPHL